MNKILLATVVSVAIVAAIAAVFLLPNYMPANILENTTAINNTNEQPMITIYCINDYCRPQQISMGAGTLVQDCYRNQTECIYALNANT